MLTTVEKIIFIAAVLFAIYAAIQVTFRIVKVVNRGSGNVDWRVVPPRLFAVIAKTISFQPVFQFRFLPSLFHAFIGWAFIFYLLVNLADVLEGLFLDFELFGTGTLGNWFRLTADILSVAALVGMTALIIRRFITKPETLSARKDILLTDKAREVSSETLLLWRSSSWFMLGHA